MKIKINTIRRDIMHADNIDVLESIQEDTDLFRIWKALGYSILRNILSGEIFVSISPPQLGGNWEHYKI